MSNPPGSTKVFASLEELARAIREIRDRAARLDADFRTRLAREKLRRKGAEQEEDTLAAMQAKSEAIVYQSVQAAENRKFESRKVRINKAAQEAREQRLAEIEKKVNASKYEAQRLLLQAERERESKTAATSNAAKEFSTRLEKELSNLEELERDAGTVLIGYGSLSAGFLKAYEQSAAETGDHRQMFQQMAACMGEARRAQGQLKRSVLFQAFRYVPVWMVLAVLPFLASVAVNLLNLGRFSYLLGAEISLGIVILTLLMRWLTQRWAGGVAGSMSRNLARARRLHEASTHAASVYTQNELRQIADTFAERSADLDRELNADLDRAEELRTETHGETEGRVQRALARNQAAHQQRLQVLEADYKKRTEAMNGGANSKASARAEALRAAEAALEADHRRQWDALIKEWQDRVYPVCRAFDALKERAQTLFPPWTDPAWAKWSAPMDFAALATFGQADVDLEILAGGLPKDKRLELPGPKRFNIQLPLTYPEDGSVLFETAEQGRDEGIGALNNLVLRLLAVAPPGRLNFSIIDPVRLGENFAGVMHLADYEAQLINGRIWTQSGQIEEKLGELNAHMEKVIQMYLRNEYATIAEYNEQAGVIAEKYHFLVIADFPVNFTETSLKRLMSIVSSGAKCGVYVLMHWDRRHPVPTEFVPDEFRRHCFPLVHRGGKFLAFGKALPGVEISLDPEPPVETATTLVHRIGEASRDSGRVEVPFQHVAPADGEMWTENTVSELRVAVGRTGATKLQYLAIGKGTCQHGLVAGKTGSGKSTLFHVIVTNLSLWCSPEQVEFYLIDFKKGVEFKAYAQTRLPHARVVAIESDREFGLSVLERVDEELRRRGDLFRKLGVQDLGGYQRAGGREKMPRTLLIIDEFQEFFVEDDKISQTASLLLDRIVRQGRAFGIHVLLGSQTLGGAYSVARTTLGQMVIRIALQCNEADAYLIMDENNPAPRLLSRPGEAIYNDMAGAIEGNSPFQVVWLPDQERVEQLKRVRARADANGEIYPGPIVFEGNVPADIRENTLLSESLQRPSAAPATVRLWLGAPNSIKGPTEAVFSSQGGSHLLMVGQNEEALLSLVSVGLIALAAQRSEGTRVVVFDAQPPDAPGRRYLERVVQDLPQAPALARPGDAPQILGEIAAELARRAERPEAAHGAPIFVFIHGLQRFARLRYEEEFSFSSPEPGAPANPAVLLNSLIMEGGRLGIHVIITVDTYNNVNRYLNRKALSEFGMRVLFQMSATDSASLIDSPKAGSLGMHRALFCSEHEGYLETFRPYALPPEEWISRAAAQIAAGSSLLGKAK